MVRIQPSDLAVGSKIGLFEMVYTCLADRSVQLNAKQLRVEVDLDGLYQDLNCNCETEHVFGWLLDIAIERSTASGDLLISAAQTFRGFEIEIADSNAMVDLPTNAFSPCDTLNLRWLGNRFSQVAKQLPMLAPYEVFCTKCPQGGLAMSLIVRPDVDLGYMA